MLFRLRSLGETGYKIPRGGLYERVSCPNYLGEMLEWIGWALAAWSLAGLAFAVFTIAKTHNLDFKEWFRFLYLSLLQKDQGPRLGSFFAMLGFDEVEQLFDKAIQASESAV